MQRGSVVGVTINGVVKGISGTPGEVRGYFSSGKSGSLLQNTDCGVFGAFAALPQNLTTQPMSLGTRNQVQNGKAYILCTLDGTTPCKYDVEISDIKLAATGNKCFTVKVTDKALLDKTGGIIQGMSGSPIIQNGKLVGAVTHVLINDPTTGYGIFIENMLTAAQMPMAKAS
jgi:stage IV sporulation protein B